MENGIAINIAKARQDIGTLLSAYKRGVLHQNHRQACAVSHLVATGLGCSIMPKEHDYLIDSVQWMKDGQNVEAETSWGIAFNTTQDGQELNFKAYEQNQFGMRQHIDSTGYSVHQLANIEFEFESTRESYVATRTSLNEGLVNAVKAICKACNVPFRNVAPTVYAAIRAREKQQAQ